MLQLTLFGDQFDIVTVKVMILVQYFINLHLKHLCRTLYTHQCVLIQSLSRLCRLIEDVNYRERQYLTGGIQWDTGGIRWHTGGICIVCGTLCT